MKRSFLIAATLLLGIPAGAKVTLPHVFSDNMVLQRQTEVAFWGTADAGKKVTIAPSWTKAKTVVTAGPDGKWNTKVATPAAGGPYEITVSDGEKVTFSNVLVGEVWFCSGQSNMQMPVRGFSAQPVEGSMDVILGARKSVPIRMCTVKSATSPTELDDCICSWEENTPDAVAKVSATAYFFAQQLQTTLDVPVGILVSHWGGTKIESWMSREALASVAPETNFKHLEKPVKDMHRYPCTLFNAMVAPVIPYTVKGWIWYQGESNRNAYARYASLMEGYARMMRNRWSAPDMPFYYVQIAPYIYDGPELTSGALLMEAQEKALDIIPRSGMATTLDAGDLRCIHPARKRQVGQRLAALALCHDYGMTALVADAPRFKGFTVDGGKMILSFKVDSQGLAPLGKAIEGFEVAGEDKVFHPAEASISKDRRRVEVTVPDGVGTPVAVRYAFHNFGSGNLTSTWGIPVGPFRSDDWEK